MPGPKRSLWFVLLSIARRKSAEHHSLSEPITNLGNNSRWVISHSYLVASNLVFSCDYSLSTGLKSTSTTGTPNEQYCNFPVSFPFRKCLHAGRIFYREGGQTRGSFIDGARQVADYDTDDLLCINFQASGPYCGIAPNDSNFKRSTIRRQLTPAEMAIKKRQYVAPKFKRVGGR